MLEEVCSALARGGIRQALLLWHLCGTAEGAAHGPQSKTGDEVPIAPRRVLVFRPSHVLKAVINGETPHPEAEE